MDLAHLTLATFEPLVGDEFSISTEDATVTLMLESATGLPAQPGDREPFSLVFRGPSQPLLAQAIYRLEHAELEVLEIFIVPIGQNAGATSYEAIFT